jgi:macrolide transport system ATP-binding/permease protein
MILSVSHLHKAYGHLTVLNDVSLTLDRAQRVGIVGANGSGKSTLLTIIVGEQSADSGTVTLEAGAEVGYLPQVLEGFANQTVQAILDAAVADITALETQMRDLEAQLATAAPETLDALLAQYGAVTERFERKEGYDLPHRIEMVLDGMQVATLERSRLASTLSGGEKARIGLAMLLLRQPDLLLLDEPTNHLDLNVLAWLESYVHDYKGAVLVVSHDRRFLNNTVNVIIELDDRTHTAKRYSGNYDDYLLAKGQEMARWQAEYVAQQEELSELRHSLRTKVSSVDQRRPMRDRDKMMYDRAGERAQQSRSSTIQAVQERIARIEADPVPRPPVPLRINPDFDPRQLANRTPLWTSELTKKLGERCLIDHASLSVSTEDRIVIVGANGSGKSTLLKLFAGEIAPDSGELYVAPTVTIGYLDQEQEALDPTATLFEAYAEGMAAPPEQLKGDLFHYGLFVYDDVTKRIAELSVGQRRKVQLARLIAARANLLLLDEPTNHLSFEVLEAFETALLNFPGPVVAVSHDRYFIERFATRIWELRDGRLIEHHDLGALSIFQRRVA